VRPPRLVVTLACALAAALLVPAVQASDGLITFSQQGKYFGAAIVGAEPANGQLTGLAEIPGGVIESGSWSPRGDRLAYATDAYGHSQVILATIFDDAFLTTTADEQLDPAFSPAGGTLALALQPFGGRSRIALFTAAGGMLAPALTPSTSDARGPHWSPDGKQLAFDSNRNGSWDVFVMNADGTNVRDVTPSSAANEHVTDWSPDGLTLLVSSDASGNADLYRVGLTTGTQTRLTTGPGQDVDAVYAPSGTRIAFSSDIRGSFEVYTMNADGSALKQLTDDQGRDLVLDWQPRANETAPVVRVFPTTIVRGKALALRFSVRDDDTYDSVSFDLSGQSADGSDDLGSSGGKLRADGKVITTRIDVASITRFVKNAPHNIRFCVTAIDPSFNGPTTACTRVTVRKAR
jgi:dipeptidyl aminopeptidase/acylaminoacyl peptidase